MSRSVRIVRDGRPYDIPVVELTELGEELGALSADETLGPALVLGCVTLKAIVESAIAEATANPEVDFGPNEDLAFVSAIANMIGRGTAGPALVQLRTELLAPRPGT